MFDTRETWLNRFTEAARPVFADIGFELPEKIRVSVGFPSTGNRSKNKRIGECWSNKASADSHFEIFIHPELQGESARVADILTHELCHTATPGMGHNRVFKLCATKIGLVGKATCTVAGPHWHAWADEILEQLGPIPGAALNALQGERKKQTTRMLRAECDDCGMIFRMSAKYLDRDLRCPDAMCGGHVSVAV